LRDLRAAESKTDRLKPFLQNPRSIKFRKKERHAQEGAEPRETQGISLLDSAPSVSRRVLYRTCTCSPNDSGLVLAMPPSRLGETSFGGFGGKSFLHLSPRHPKSLGTAARLLIASAPLPSRRQR